MPLATLPKDIVLLIGDHLGHGDINALAQTSRFFYNTLNHYLYRRSLISGEDLKWAIREGHVQFVRRFIQMGADVDGDFRLSKRPQWLRQEHWPLLCLATRYGRANMVQLLLDKGADPNAQYVYNLPQEAISGLAKGPKPIKNRWALLPKDAVRGTSLALAAGQGLSHIIKILLTAEGIDPDIRDHRDVTPLWLAAKEGSLEIVRMLAERGADVNILPASTGTSTMRPGLGNSALGNTVWHLNFDMMQYLLDKGADPNLRSPDGPSPLMVACRFGDMEIITALLDKGADPNSRMGDSSSLSIAATNNHLEVMKLLVKYGAIATGRSAEEGNLPLQSTGENWECLDYLIELGVGVNDLCKGEGALHRAAAAGDIETAKFLLERGANLNLGMGLGLITSGMTPMSVARRWGGQAMVRFLAEKGADPSGRDIDDITDNALVNYNFSNDIYPGKAEMSL